MPTKRLSSSGSAWRGPGSRSARYSGARQRKHLVPRPAEVCRRVGARKRLAVLADLAYQQSLRGEVLRGPGKNFRDKLQAVAPAAEGEARLMAILGRQLAHRRRADVRRIGEDQVVAPFDVFEKIGTDQPDAAPMGADIAGGHGERVARNIGGIDPG